MTPITPFLLLAPLYNAASAQKFRFPTPNEPETPNVPNPIHPVGVPHIAPPGSPGSYPQAPSQQQLQHNLGTLEEKLGHIHDVVDVVTEVVNAILATPSAATWNGVAYPVASSTRNATITPTSTLPTSSFLPCQSYAHTVNNCFSATSNFASLAPTDQASCACYSTVFAETTSCGPSSTQAVAIPTLVGSQFDVLASSCYDFFSLEGYAKAAEAIDAKNGTARVVKLGRGFCAGVDADMKEASGKDGTRPAGLKNALEPSPYGLCILINQPSGGSAGRLAGFTRLDKTVFITAPFVVGLISYLAFS